MQRSSVKEKDEAKPGVGDEGGRNETGLATAGELPQIV